MNETNKEKWDICKGNHTLIEILRDEMVVGCRVVQWCNKCGAVVVDGECDGRIYPGKYSKMRLPEK